MEVATKAPPRWWGELDENRLRVWRADRVTCAEIARRLGRPLMSVEAKCRHLGIRVMKMVRPHRRDAMVRRLHAEGATVWEMARRFRCGPCAVYKVHRRLGLVPNRRGCDYAAQGRKGYARTRQRYDGQHMSQYRLERERVAAVFAGWPPVTRHARLALELVERLGPVSLPAYHAAAGRRSHGATGRLLWRLANEGHLERVGRVGHHRQTPVYDLAPAVKESRRRTKAFQEARAGVLE